MGGARWITAISAALAVLAMMVHPARAEDDGEFFFVPVARIAIGPGIQVHPSVRPDFALDISAGTIALSGMGVILGGELGYTLDTSTLHAFHLAGTVGVGSPLVGASYRPRFLVGGHTPEGGVVSTSLGMRNAVMLHFLADMFSFEAGHQFMTTDRGLQHDVHLLFGFNPAVPVFMLLAATDALKF